MKIELLKNALEEADKKISHEVKKCTKYYFHNQQWRNLENNAVIDTEKTSKLNSAIQAGHHYDSSLKTAWYYINEHKAAIEVEFTQQRVTRVQREKYKSLIEEVVINSTNAYKVNHNVLTGLYSREKFRKLITEDIKEFDSISINSDDPISLNIDFSPFSLTLLAFDIDKFKQVNDTWGHLYGDLVLKAFAMRLEKIKDQLISKSACKKIELAHVSGEEFFAYIVGNLSDDDIRGFSESFRSGIEKEQLPNDTELESLISEYPKVAIPPLQDRKITASIGVETLRSVASVEPETEMLALFNKSDMALIRSKSGGRNRVTFSDEILQSCGKVLEYDEHTGVVAIDIGSEHGVNIGQEFKVYPPTYSGNTPFIEDDGRTKKIKGLYPKIETARIIVFNSQDEISFSHIIDNPKISSPYIPVGASLESIPLGHINDLVITQKDNFIKSLIPNSESIVGLQEFNEFLKYLESNSKKAYAAIFRFSNEKDFLKKYGIASLNRALAELYTKVNADFKDQNTRVGTIDKTSVCIVGEDYLDSQDKLSQIISEFKSHHAELRLICGYYSPDAEETTELFDDFDDFDDLDDTTTFNPKVSYSLDLARFTISNVNVYKENEINRFSIGLAETYIQELRVNGAHDVALADYEKLNTMGVITASLENNIGLIYSSRKDNLRALDHYRKAYELDESSIVYKSNYAIIANRLEQVDEGLRVLNTIPDNKLESFKRYKFGYQNYALLLAKAYYYSFLHFDEARFIKIAEDIISEEDIPSLVRQLYDQLSDQNSPF